jgi:hypothetical protein
MIHSKSMTVIDGWITIKNNNDAGRLTLRIGPSGNF